MRPYADKNYLMAVSEAGSLPLYSGWKALDTWGLNDQWIAHHGVVTTAYLEYLHPHLIMFHAPFSSLVPDSSRGEWGQMLGVLKGYAETNDFELAAIFGLSPFETYYYYVRRNFKDSDEILRTIRGMDYRLKGRKCIDYRLVVPVRN